jgi:homoserine kinase type II
MGLFTELPLADARSLGAEYGLEVTAVEPLAAGSVNSNFRLVASDGRRYFARIYEEQGKEGAVLELELLRALARSGLPVVAPLSGSAGGGVAEVRGKPFAVYPWVDGDILCQARVEPRHAEAVGRALGGLHLATPSLPALAAGRFRVEDLEQRLDRIERESSEHRDAAALVRAKLRHYAALRDPAAPSGVVHGDLFRDNVLWKGDRIEALIDFESASRGVFAFDVMVTLLAWCYGDAFRSELVGAFLRGYGSVRPISATEWSLLPIEGAVACLRFATTRITDFSMRAAPGEVPKRDFRRFLRRLEALEAGLLEPFRAAIVRP